MISESITEKLTKIVYLLLSALIFLLIAEAMIHPYRRGVFQSDTIALTDWTLLSEGKEQEVTLPFYYDPSAPRSTVVLSKRITPGPGDSLYVKTVYAPLRVYINKSLVYEYGHGRIYPAFLSDPPTNVSLIPIEEVRGSVLVEMEYQTPVSRDSLALHPILMGTSDGILNRLFSEMGFSLFFSIALLTLGIVLLLLSLIVIRLHRAGFSFFWLALFSISVGVWVLGECNLTALFVPNPALLYLLAFMGLFSFTIPIYKFVLLITDLKKKGLIIFMGWVMIFSFISALLLQLTGQIQFSQSMYLFHLLQPSFLFLMGGCILTEASLGRNGAARNFAFPMIVLAAFAILEVANYYVLHITNQMSLFFQIGVLIFVLLVILICGDYVKNALTAQSERHRLEYENHLMERQIAVQKERYATLMQIDSEIRAQRHDLRHQFIVLRRFAQEGELEKLTEYLDTLTINIPVALTRYCENETVNAVAAYYAALVEKAGISQCEISLQIPARTGRIPETALCIIIGNLLENALEACHYVKDSPPFIHMKSRIHYGTLTIVMDNSVHSVALSDDGRFLSHKHGGGTGLRSIRAVAEKYDGNAEFKTVGRVFSSSVYLQLF